MNNLTLLLFILSIAFFSCKKDEKQTYDEATKQLLVPYIAGSYIVYKVDSAIYDDFKDTVLYSTSYIHYQIDSINNGIQGRKLYSVNVYQKKDSNAPWNYDKTHLWALTDKYFETQFDNFRTIALSFPLNLETLWNFNLYNSSQSINRYYLAVDDTFKMRGIIYKNVVKVENEPKSNSVLQKNNFEVYAKKIGCIYKKITNIETQLGKKRGYQIIYTLHDYKI